MADKIKVVLVDDHQIVRQGLHGFLSEFDDLIVVGVASSGEEALRDIETWLPDVVVMDMFMPGEMEGIETIRRIQALAPNTRVVVLTSYAGESQLLAALQAGAIGYVRKEAHPEVLLACVRAAARGQSLLDPAVAEAVMQDLQHGGKHGAELTEREQEVLRQLALGRTNHEIAETLVMTDETVRAHIGNILTKLQLAQRT